MKVKVRLIQQTQLSDYISAIAWSPENHYFAACSAVGELIVSQPHASPVSLQQAKGISLSAIDFSAQGKFLAAAGQVGTLKIWDLEQSEPKLILNEEYASTWIDTLQWHPQKPLLAYAVGRDVYVIDPISGTVCAKFPFQNSSVLSLAWHPKEDYLAVSGHGGVKVWDFSQPDTPPQKIAVPGASLTIAWSQNGSYLASGNLDRTLTLSEWQNPPPWLMQGFPGKVRNLSWSSTDSSPLLAAACSDGITVWERQRGSDQWDNSILEYHQGFVRAICFHPQKSLLASAGEDGIIVLWKQGKKPIQTLKSPSGGFSCLTWQLTGHYLAAGTSSGDILIWEFLKQKKKGFG
ncbi:MAG: hypothetical protein RI580_14030 [Halothece sp. Uz-M2-17]|nr:hypothetical protein [Halothece sp. Uz-M2-17]